MSDRSTDDLDKMAPGEPAPEPALPPVPARVEPPRLPLVELNYPDPTPLAVIVRDVSRWSGQSFVMEPSVNARLQIFSARRLPPGDAYELFLASLSVVGLRAVQMGKIVKIVPIILSVSA